ncbi:MAG: hypothetical protein RBS08_09895 [Bdellovibrionales bacterium]|jgi:hypothetical protein|nr:hypothetical protein [Bdellovibrionales bacterium]
MTTAFKSKFYTPPEGGMKMSHVLNPLQHLPIVDGLYRDKTGENIGVKSRIAGGMLWGGIITAGLGGAALAGAAISGGASLADAEVERRTGKDIGAHIVSKIKTPVVAQPQVPAAPKRPAMRV